MQLIGICGKKGSGKDTAGATLASIGYHQVAFAEALKLMMARLYEYLKLDSVTASKMIFGDLKEMPVPELGGHSTRYAMQTLGTEWGRLCLDRDLWVNIGIAKAKQYGKAVITDVRFPNEAEAIKEQGGVIIRLLRTDALTGDGHASEQVDNIVPDYFVDNNESLQNLKLRILEIENEYARS